jgi:molybdopterin-guanine dinucleotide biosynthesis protein B
MGKVVAFTGPSGSGKTTLIEKIAQILAPNHRVSIVKNDPGDKAQFDVAGKDSHRFFSTGAEVAVISPTRTTLFSHRTRSVDEVIELFGDFDYLLVEGLKNLPLPRIAIFRGQVQPDYFPFSQAIAIDGSVDLAVAAIPRTLDQLDLNNPEAIIDWIDRYAKEVQT